MSDTTHPPEPDTQNSGVCIGDVESGIHGAIIAGRDVIVNLARIGSASKFSGKIEEFLEEYLVRETGPVPFGGRAEDFALLDAWLDDETAPPRYLLTAPAGRGKSALLVRWYQHL